MSKINLSKSYILIMCISLLLITGYAASSKAAEIPHLRKQGTATQLIIDGKPLRRYEARISGLLDLVGLTDRRSHKPDQLSGGEQQRVAIARALANEPQILLADEPTGEVDSKTSDHILSILEQLNRDKGLTMVVVSHDPTVANRAPRRLTMMDGRIEGDRSGPVVTGAPHAGGIH